ncbi:MAG: hypothetical protein AAF892_07305 [Cyanobacteria bacterium P01_D01_bin.71]
MLMPPAFWLQLITRPSDRLPLPIPNCSDRLMLLQPQKSLRQKGEHLSLSRYGNLQFIIAL